MAKVFSFASWNVDQLTDAKSTSGNNVVVFLTDSGPPDVFGIFEVKGSKVFSDFVIRMPSHQFFITKDLGPIEILIGVNRNLQVSLAKAGLMGWPGLWSRCARGVPVLSGPSAPLPPGSEHGPHTLPLGGTR